LQQQLAKINVVAWSCLAVARLGPCQTEAFTLNMRIAAASDATKNK